MDGGTALELGYAQAKGNIVMGRCASALATYASIPFFNSSMRLSTPQAGHFVSVGVHTADDD